MKKSITILALLAGATGLYAQGTIALTDYGFGFGMSVWSPQTIVSQELQGNTVNDNPSGSVGIGGNSTTYQGVPIGGGSGGATSSANYGNGALFTVGIYAAPGVGNTAGLLAAETTGQPVAVSSFLTSGGTGVVNDQNAGNDTSGMYALNYNANTLSTLNGYSGGATFQMLAWYNGGVASTLANADAQYALAAATTEAGSSTIESIATLGGNGAPAAQPGTFDNNASGQRTGLITSFSLVETLPEPSTIALGVLGASSFLFRRRK